MNLNRTSYSAFCHAIPAQESDFNLLLMDLIDEEYTRHPFYGSRKRVAYLNRQGHPANRKRIQRLMRKMGLQSVAPKA